MLEGFCAPGSAVCVRDEVLWPSAAASCTDLGNFDGCIENAIRDGAATTIQASSSCGRPDTFEALDSQAVEIAGMAMATDAPTSVDEKRDLEFVGGDYGGRWVVSPSGWLSSTGHPLGATGIAQCPKLNSQPRVLATLRVREMTCETGTA